MVQDSRAVQYNQKEAFEKRLKYDTVDAAHGPGKISLTKQEKVRKANTDLLKVVHNSDFAN